MTLNLRILNLGKLFNGDIEIRYRWFHIDCFIITGNRMGHFWNKSLFAFHIFHIFTRFAGLRTRHKRGFPKVVRLTSVAKTEPIDAMQDSPITLA